MIAGSHAINIGLEELIIADGKLLPKFVHRHLGREIVILGELASVIQRQDSFQRRLLSRFAIPTGVNEATPDSPHLCA